MTLKVLDLFSGIGGFSLGLERAGFETVAFCEIEEYPQKILSKHWPDIPVVRDIRDIEYLKSGNEPDDRILIDRSINSEIYRGSIDVVCGGFPCQPFSVAGKQKGKEDDRHLWPEMLRIIKESKPAWVIGENVAGFVRMALDDVQLDLENEGYTSQPFVIPACAVGGIHRRDRVWILAYSEHNGAFAATEPRSERPPILNNADRPDEAGEPEGICVTSNVADAKCPGLEGHAGANKNQERWKAQTGSVTTTCVSRNWEPVRLPTESPICRGNDGLPDRVARLKALGNAVVPQIPEMIGRAIMATYK